MERNRAGFTLIEVIIVIAILSIVAGAMAPMAVRMIDGSRRDLTLKRQEAVLKAILGDPSAPGSGFLSDIGRLPGTSLAELTLRGSLPAYTVQPCGTNMGWRGPYVFEGVDANGLIQDGWGTPMGLVGGQIHSAGPDRDPATTGDNILFPPAPLNPVILSGNITMTVLALDTGTAQPTFVPAGGQTTIYFAQNGQMQSALLTSASGTYTYPPAGTTLPQGIYAITVTGDPDGPGSQPARTGTVTVYCPGGGTVHKTVALR